MDTHSIDGMRFINLDDFAKRCVLIKDRFNLLSEKDRILYKMYVYSNSFMKVANQDKIWEYLNEPFGSCYYLNEEMLEEYVKNEYKR